jgi:adenylate cyclase
LGVLKIIRLRFARAWWIMLIVAALATGVAVLFWQLDLFGIHGQELGAYDSGLSFWTRAPAESKDVVIVAIDDFTFAKVEENPTYKRAFGSWPYSRRIWANVYDQLAKDGARAVIFDATMTEGNSDPGADDNMVAAIEQTRLPVYVGVSVIAGGRELPVVKAANRFGPVAKKAPEPPKKDEGFDEGGFEEETEKKPEGEDLGHAAQAITFPVEWTGGLAPATVPPDPAVQDPKLPILPMAKLFDTLSGFGLVTTESDDDGKMRSTAFAYQVGGNSYVTLSVAAVADLYKADKVVLAPGKLQIGDRQYAINPNGSAWIDYGGSLQQRFRSVPLYFVFNDNLLLAAGKKRDLDPALFKDKVVLIGGFAVGTQDVKSTPFARDEPGVVKHAAEIDSLLGGRFIVDAPFWVSLLLTLAVAFFSVMVILVVKQPLFELIFPIALFFLFFLLPGFILVNGKVHLLSVMPSLAGSIASVMAAAFNHLFAGKERDEYRETFSRYMEKSLVDQMVEGKHLPTLEGEIVEMTAFFSDIRGFSTFSERFKDSPKTLMEILNTYLTRVTDVLVEQEQATLDKYVGDSVVALFNAPLRQEDHAIRACRAALAVEKVIAELRREFQAKGWPDVYTRIGLNTGVMLVGNLGSEKLVDYTAIGDEMNLASRLESANKAYETLIMIGPRTYELAKDAIEARELDWVRVPGKTIAVATYELIALKGQMTPQQHQLCALYARALALYRQAQFADALPLLTEALRQKPDDGPSKVLAARCEQYAAEPPKDFEPVTNLTK